MQFENVHIQHLISQFKAFSVEGFNIFGISEDDLSHLICVCPNKDFARAFQSLLAIAKYAETLQATTAEIRRHCYLSPMLLADGRLALVATVLDNEIWEDGNEVKSAQEELHFGSLEYERFVSQFLVVRESGPLSGLQLYEDTLKEPLDSDDEFPF